ncbi:winged helix-turn-helix domain-containing protein [Paracoccus homiensis]|uniref:Molybdate transport system regulatory protein n=1 Tax=Paracoccus homiensis TaxID=364199 RepID=A0A1I0B3D5_9RHOB|nr:LysR family transcriptional regulator [Paracoccus homiensis]SET01188.1 molybdate transport system regulatory protein [Paracoccus homiensis]
MIQPPAPAPRIKLRLEYDAPLVLGPGKARLMELVDRLGSISAAGRDMGMSYKRAWSLVEEMNGAFAGPVIQSSRGGSKGGGAELTDLGREVLRHYRNLEQLLHLQGAGDLAALQALMRRPD